MAGAVAGPPGPHVVFSFWIVSRFTILLATSKPKLVYIVPFTPIFLAKTIKKSVGSCTAAVWKYALCVGKKLTTGRWFGSTCVDILWLQVTVLYQICLQFTSRCTSSFSGYADALDIAGLVCKIFGDYGKPVCPGWRRFLFRLETKKFTLEEIVHVPPSLGTKSLEQIGLLVWGVSSCRSDSLKLTSSHLIISFSISTLNSATQLRIRDREQINSRDRKSVV